MSQWRRLFYPTDSLHSTRFHAIFVFVLNPIQQLRLWLTCTVRYQVKFWGFDLKNGAVALYICIA